MKQNMSTTPLERLHTHPRFGSAANILKEATLYYRHSFNWIRENLKDATDADRIIDLVRRLSDLDATFLFRSSPIRYYIDKVINGIFEVDTDYPVSQRRDNWKNLDDAIRFVLNEDGTLNRQGFSNHSLMNQVNLLRNKLRPHLQRIADL